MRNIIENNNKEIELINKNGVIFASSRSVSNDFDKRHDNVVAKIGNKIKEWENDTDLKNKVSEYFIESSYNDASGKLNKEYLLTRDGFSYLVMGFTGARADKWKIKYIDAFNKMELHIKNNIPKITREQQIELQILAGNTVDVFELKEYKDRISRIAELKASDGTDKLMTLTQITSELNKYLDNPILTTTILNEFLSDILELGEYKRIGKDKKRSFLPNEKFQEVITKTGGSFTGITNKRDKIKIQFSNGMLDYILKYKSQLMQYINEMVA